MCYTQNIVNVKKLLHVNLKKVHLHVVTKVNGLDLFDVLANMRHSHWKICLLSPKITFSISIYI